MTTSLSIVVTSKDEASATLNKVAQSGKNVGTQLSSAGTRGTAAISSVDKRAAAFTTTLKKVGQYVGIGFAVAEVIRFGKESLHAFEDLERQENLVRGGLERIGAANQFPQLEDDLKAVSDSTVTLQGQTQQVAAAVLNVGHAYFQSLGPDASRVLSGLTEGILNISAATHKSLPMLQRSLTMAVINTPEKAVPMLQKLGVVSADQATQFQQMAKGGHEAALRQAEVNAVSRAYAHAASGAATSGDRLGKAMDDLKIRLGKVFEPIVGVTAQFAAFAASNPVVVAGLLGTVAALRVLPLLLGQTAAGLQAIGAESTASRVAGMGMAIGRMGIAAKLAATAGVTLLVTEVMSLGSAAADQARNIQQFFDALDQGTYSVKQLKVGIDKVAQDQGLPDWWRTGMHSALRSAQGQQREAERVKGAMESVSETSVTTGHLIAESTTKFAGMAEKAWKKWARSIKQDARSSITSVGGVELATHKTARAFLHDSDRMAKAAAQDAAAIKRLASRSQEWIPEGYRKWLIDQGPQAVANFEQLTKTKQQEAVGDWKKAQGGAAAYQKTIDKLSPRSIDAANRHAEALARTLDGLVSRPYYIDVYLRQHGLISGASGGSSGDGSGGPSLPTGVSPAMREWAKEPKIEVTIDNRIDRKQFVRGLDYDARYSGKW